MTVSKHAMHGRDHRRGGADPVPDLDLEYAYITYASSTSLVPGTLTPCDVGGTIYTNEAETGTYTLDTWAATGAEAFLIGSKGLGIHRPGLYWVSIGIEGTKASWASGAPVGYQLQIDDHGETSQLNQPAFGSKNARGLLALNETDGTETATVLFDPSYSVLMAISDTDDAPGGKAPITLTAIQNSPETLNAYPNILVVKLDRNNFNLFA